MIVIDAFAIASILLAVYHPSLLFILCALFAVLLAMGFTGAVIEKRRSARWSRRDAALWRIIKEDNARL